MPARTGFTLLNRVPSGKFNRVKVNIPDKFLQIGIFLADNGLACPVKAKCHNLIMWNAPESGQSSARYFKTMII